MNQMSGHAIIIVYVYLPFFNSLKIYFIAISLFRDLIEHTRDQFA